MPDINGGDGNDRLCGTTESDLIQGLGGNDTLAAHDGTDTLDGGVGFDVLDLFEITAGATVDLADGVAFDSGTGVYTRLISIEGVLGTGSEDILLGDEMANRLVGAGSDDAIRGRGGNDTLVGGPGDDRLDGGAGIDVVAFDGIGFRGAMRALAGDGDVLVLDTALGTDVLAGVEAAIFADGRLVFDADDRAAQVVRLYQAALGRDADQGGLNNWTAAMDAGRPISDLANGFLGSQEFNARFGDLSDNGAFIERMYQNVLGREADAGGKENWLKAMNGGLGRADVLVGFSESGENKLNTADIVQNGIWDRSETATQIARLYDTVLGRLPDINGLVNWKTAVEHGGMSMATVADGFCRSAEFQAVYGELDNTRFMQTLYRNTLEREADQAGLENWLRYLDSGAARSDAVLAFSESQEHINLTAANIQSGNHAEYGIHFA